MRLPAMLILASASSVSALALTHGAAARAVSRPALCHRCAAPVANDAAPPAERLFATLPYLLPFADGFRYGGYVFANVPGLGGVAGAIAPFVNSFESVRAAPRRANRTRGGAHSQQPRRSCPSPASSYSSRSPHSRARPGSRDLCASTYSRHAPRARRARGPRSRHGDGLGARYRRSCSTSRSSSRASSLPPPRSSRERYATPPRQCGGVQCGGVCELALRSRAGIGRRFQLCLLRDGARRRIRHLLKCPGQAARPGARALRCRHNADRPVLARCSGDAAGAPAARHPGGTRCTLVRTRAAEARDASPARER